MKSTRAIKIAVGLALITLLVYFTGTRDLLEALSNITFGAVAALALIAFCMIYVSSLKWRLFLQRHGNSPSIMRLCSLYLVGYFVNLVMPSYVAGDVVRSLYVAKSGERHEAFSATFLERYTGLVAMVFMALIGVCISSAVTYQIQVAVVVVAIGLVCGSWIAFTDAGRWLCARLPLKKAPIEHLQRIRRALQFGVQDPGLLAKAGLLSLLFHILTVVNTIAVAYAVGWTSPPAVELCVVVPLILLVGAIPLSPQGLGIQEGAFFYFLQTVGATPEQAMAVGLVLRAKSYVLALFGGFIWMGLRSESNASTDSLGKIR